MVGQELHRDDGQHGLQGVHRVGDLNRLKRRQYYFINCTTLGGGCCSVDRKVASDTRGLGLEPLELL